MKTKEELNSLKEEIENLNKNLAELTEEELEQVSAGAHLDKYIKILIGTDKMIVDTELVPKLELNSTIKYNEDGNIHIILRDKPDA